MNLINNEFEVERNYPCYILENSVWKSISVEEMGSISNNLSKKNSKNMLVYLLAEIWNLHLINKYEITELVVPCWIEFNGKFLFRDSVEYYEIMMELFDENLPVKIYFHHSRHEHIELTVYPVKVKKSINENDAYNSLSIGYVAWQSAKLVAYLTMRDCQKQDASSVLSSLQLASIQIKNNNVCILDIST